MGETQVTDEYGKGRPVLVYILAASHSGSTLAAMLLNAHPAICTAGELKATNLGDADQYRCSCQQLIGECEFWQAVSAQMKQRGFDYDIRHAGTSLRDIPGMAVQRLLRPLYRGPAFELIRDSLLALLPRWRSGYSAWRDRNISLVETISETSGARYVADSSKIGIRLKYLKRIDGLDVKVIRLVRDGRAVALTYMNPGRFADARDPSLRGGGSGNDETFHHRLSMERAATEWRRSNEEAEALLKRLPDSDWLQVTYEDMCERTSETMERIYAFLELEFNTNFERFRDVPHHIVGNGMRLDAGNEISLDDRWRCELSESDLADFDRVAGELNRRYGYC